MFTFQFNHFDWLSQLYSERRQTSKLVNLNTYAKVFVFDFGQNLKMTKTFSFCSIHQENTSQSSLHLNLIILTDFHSFTVNERNLQNFSIFKFSAKVRVCDLGQNLIMTKTSSFISIHQEATCKSSLHLNLIIWLTFTALQWMKTNFKISQFEDFCKGLGIRSWLKFEND